MQNGFSSLAVKYRPRSFATLTGQKHVSSILRSAIETGRVPQQILFSGSSGLGKTTVARICASAILCETPLSERDHGDACLKCNSCLDISDPSRNHPDVIEFDAASNGGKDDIKDIATRATLAPLRGSWKIYIIDEAHGLSGPGGQAFLKLLEEPPSHVIFMLATTDPQKMLKTNRSRCVEFELLRPSNQELVANLERVAKGEGWNLSESTAASVIAATDLSLGVRGTLMTLEKLAPALTQNLDIDGDLLAQLLGIPSEEKLALLTDALEAYKPAEAFSALSHLRSQVSDGAIRTALTSWARLKLVESFSSGSSAHDEALWRYKVLIEAPSSSGWTEALVAQLSRPYIAPSAEALAAQLSRAEKVMFDLGDLLQRAPSPSERLDPPNGHSQAPRPSTQTEPVASRPGASVSPSRTPQVPPRAEKNQVRSQGGSPSPHENLSRTQEKDSTRRPSASVTNQGPTPPRAEKTSGWKQPESATRSPGAKSPSPDVPRAPRNVSTTPAPGDTAARKLDGATKVFLGAIPAGRDDIRAFLVDCEVRVANGIVTLRVPPPLHVKANLFFKELKAAAERINHTIKFESS